MKIFRPLILTYIIFNLSIAGACAQAGSWTWVSGDNTLNAGGSGVKGIPSINNAPTSRYACGNWVDTAGNFWVYSGLNASDDLWRFNPQTTEWTWMTGGAGVENIDAPTKGVYDSLNDPGALAYGMLSWTTPDNHLWLFGGLYNYGSYNIDDNLWQYNPAINQWAWMGNFGPTNYGTMGVGDNTTMPGGRQEGNCAWVDKSGNLWLFGGCDVTYQSYNDLWEYNVSTGIWTWLSGSPNLNDGGQYGVIGSAWDQYYPSGRSTNFFWTDTAGNFWIGGGTQHQNDLMFQDIWELNPNNLAWTWVDGIDGPDTTSPTGENCIASLSNVPGRRYENRATWKQCEDLILTYNGFTDWKDSTITVLNDMWGYKISSNEWTKINSWPLAGNYGLKGVSSPGNAPPSRIGGVGFTGRDNALWLFGGQNNTGYFNDLWKYVLDTTCVSCSRSCALAPPLITTDKPTFCADSSTRICAPNTYASYQWNEGDSSSCITVAQAGDYYVTVTGINGCTAESNHLLVNVYPVPPVSITEHGDTLTSFGSVGYQWTFDGNPIQGATSDLYVVKQQGNYAVAATDSNGCINTSNQVYVTVGISDLEEQRVSIFPNPSTGAWQLTVGTGLLGGKLEVYDGDGQIVFQSEIRNPKAAINLNVASGIYWLRISSASTTIVRKLVKL